MLLSAVVQMRVCVVASERGFCAVSSISSISMNKMREKDPFNVIPLLRKRKNFWGALRGV